MTHSLCLSLTEAYNLFNKDEDYTGAEVEAASPSIDSITKPLELGRITVFDY